MVGEAVLIVFEKRVLKHICGFLHIQNGYKIRRKCESYFSLVSSHLIQLNYFKQYQLEVREEIGLFCDGKTETK